MTVARLDDQLCFALYSASSRLTALYRPILARLHLTYPQFVVMMALWEKDGVSITELASVTGLSKPTMTPLLKRLEEKALIKMQRVAGNERQKRITLTQEGRAIAHKSEVATQTVFCATGLTQKQAQDLISLCRQIDMNAHSTA